MEHWSHIFLDKVTSAGVEVHMLTKYVDNINVVNEMLPMGTRWVSGELSTAAQWELEDWALDKSRESVTMDCLRDAADSTLGWLQFTSDLPEQHGNKMVLILDLHVWIRHPRGDEDGLGSDLIA